METNSIFIPKWLSGVIAKLERTADGGGRVVTWDNGEWSPEPEGSSIDVASVLEAIPASSERLRLAGVPDPL